MNQEYTTLYQEQFDRVSISNLDLDLSNEKAVKNYFNDIKCVKNLFFFELDSNPKKLTILFNSIKHIKFYLLYLSDKLNEKDTELVEIIGDFIKHSEAFHGFVVLPDSYTNNAARILFPYFKESKIRSLIFSNSIKLADDIINDYNSIAERQFHNDDYENTWIK